MQVQDQDPLSPPADSTQQGRDTQAPAPGFQPGNLMDSWNKWIDKPNNRAALMQFGIAMLQPVGMGETGVSHFANAVGAAGQAGYHVTEQEQQARKSDTEAELREARAYNAEQRANSASDRQSANDLIRQQQLELNSRKAYDAYTRNIEAANAKIRSDNIIAPDNEKKPEIGKMGYEEYLATIRASGGGTPAPASTTTPTPTSTATPTTTAGGTTARQMINDPRYGSAFQNIRAALASGDPNKVASARNTLNQLANVLPAAERPFLFQQFGVTPF